MKKLVMLIAVMLLVSNLSIAEKIFSPEDTGKVVVVKYTFHLYKPVTSVYKDGFLKLPGVIDYQIDSIGNCVLFAKPMNNMMYDIMQTIFKSGYKYTDMSQEELSEADYESFIKKLKTGQN